MVKLLGAWKSALVTRALQEHKEQEVTVSHWPTTRIGTDGEVKESLTLYSPSFQVHGWRLGEKLKSAHWMC